VASTSWGVSFWRVPAMRNLVRLFEYFRFREMREVGSRLSVFITNSFASSSDCTYLIIKHKILFYN
jgi:hypothetical protein